ncbi:MAG: AMP-binding protein [Pseudomonadales bacterium]|jgi:acyl-CoA synthetase (AMP-forming)/AMP-acid ligase II|nr:AMP-binding protein [Pseudomonadales bacterium]
MHPGIHAAKHPDKPAFVMAGSGETVTYGELEARSNQGAQLFRSLGLQAGDHIALMLENHPAFFTICWAAQRAGLYYTAISYRLQEEEVAYIVSDCRARVFLTSHAQRELAARLRERIDVDAAYMLDGTVPGFDAWEDALARQPATPIADETEGADMLYSSGTTGRPKGIKVPLSGEPLGSAGGLLGLASALYGMDEHVVYLSPAPLYHSAPLRYNMAVSRLGGTSVIMEKFDPEEALRLIEAHGITHAQFVPTMFVRMLKLPEDVRTKYDVSSLKVAIHAAAPCPVQVKQAMMDWWGPVIHEYYAGTEGNGFCAVGPQEWLAHPGTVGRPLLGEVHVCDDEGNEVETGETGTIYFGNGGAFEYHNDPGKTEDSKHPKEKGWTTLGDMGYVDEDGYLYLTDRKSFMIISGGVNIYPQEVENLLVTHPKVADVAVFGVPNAEFGEEVKAVVQPVDWNAAGDALAAELVGFCREHLSHIKCPKTVDFERELPRHPTGKLYKRLLRDRYWEGHGKSRIL